MESNLISSSGYTGYSPEMCTGPAARKVDRDALAAEAGQVPIERMSDKDLALYQDYLNSTLLHIDQLRYPGCFPSLADSQGETKTDGDQGGHEGQESHEGTEGHKGQEGTHGGGSTSFIETAKTAKYSHKGIEYGEEGLVKLGRTGEVLKPVPAVGASGASTAETPAAVKPPEIPVKIPEAPVSPRSGSSSGTSLPLKEPVSEDMRLYVEAVRQHQESLPPSKPAAQPTAEAPKLPLKEPITEDMRNYVEAVKKAQAEIESASASKAVPKALKAKPSVVASTETSASGLAETTSEAAHGGSKLHKTLEGANKVLGPVAVVAGGLEVAHGVNELREGKTVEGALDVGGGIAATTSGVAATTAAYSSTTAVAGIGLGAIAAGGAGVAAMADGIKGVYEGIKEKDTEKGVVGGVKTAAGAAMLAGACTGNPILVAGGAVTYVGAVVYENREAIANTAKKAYNATADAASSAYHAASGAVSSAADTVGGAAKGAWKWATSWF